MIIDEPFLATSSQRASAAGPLVGTQLKVTLQLGESKEGVARRVAKQMLAFFRGQQSPQN